MPSCAFMRCTNHSKRKNKSHGITFHSFPGDELVRHKWLLVVRKQRQEPDWTPNQHSRICSTHFKRHDIYTTNKGYYRRLSKTAVPFFKTNEAGLPLPGPSAGASSTPSHPEQDSEDSNLSTPEEVPAQDPLKKGTLEQCRFCGEFSKDCFNLAADSKPYLETNKTSLTINGLSIELDFNDETLPKTVCSNCDDKLQVMTDFVKKVLAAQNSLINVADDMCREETDVDTSLVKVEDPETTNTETDATAEDKENKGNEDALELSEVFTHKRTSNNQENKSKPNAKQLSANEQGSSVSNKVTESTVLVHKRKSVTSENTVVAPKKKIFKIDIPLQRKSNVRQHQSGNTEVIDNDKEIEINTHTQSTLDFSNATENTGLMTDIKEENIDIEEHEERSLEHDTAIVYKPDETELASDALVYEMSKS